MSGFEFAETMTGDYLRDGQSHPLQFSLRARAGSLLQHLRDRRTEVAGWIEADGLASHAEVRGEMIIDPLFGRRIRYDFSFEGDDGVRYRFAGQKDVSLLDPVRSMTTLPAEITGPEGRHVATAMVYFHLGDLPSFLASFRPRF